MDRALRPLAVKQFSGPNVDIAENVEIDPMLNALGPLRVTLYIWWGVIVRFKISATPNVHHHLHVLFDICLPILRP